MPSSSKREGPLAAIRFCNLLSIIVVAVVLIGHLASQTASTGGLTGVALDPSGAALPGVVIQLVNQGTSEIYAATTDPEGRFAFPFLPPGDYSLEAGNGFPIAAPYRPEGLRNRNAPA